MEKKYDVIHIGEANHDVRVPEIPDGFYAGGETTCLCGQVSDGCGGDALNQAVSLTNLGDHSAFYGKFGSSYPGPRVMQLLKSQGVDTSLAILSEECVTPDIICMIEKNGTHRFLVGKRRAWGLKPEEIRPEVFASAKVLAIGSLYALNTLDENGAEGLRRILQICRDAGVIVVADMTIDIASLGPRLYDDLYRYIDFMVPSEEEASFVSGERDEKKMARFFLEKGAENVIIKLGSRGSYFLNKEKAFYTDPYDIAPVDTTGCGDNFTAGLIHTLLKGLPTEECVRFASAAGALNALGIGSSSFIRSEQMVLDFMKQTPLRKIPERS